jgi:hypothetical protein
MKRAQPAFPRTRKYHRPEFDFESDSDEFSLLDVFLYLLAMSFAVWGVCGLWKFLLGAV